MITNQKGAPPETRYVYIDGAYLRERLAFYSTRYFNGDPIQLDYQQFFRDFEKKFYYDCLPPRRKGEESDAFKAREEQVKQSFDHLKELSGFHVYEGKLTGDGEKARQKGVDIQLAVHMLTHVSRGTIRRVTLLAGDADFQPLADAIVGEGGYLTLWADKRSAATSLRHAVDRGGPGCLNRFSASISGTSARVKLPCGLAAG